MVFLIRIKSLHKIHFNKFVLAVAINLRPKCALLFMSILFYFKMDEKEGKKHFLFVEFLPEGFDLGFLKQGLENVSLVFC